MPCIPSPSSILIYFFTLFREFSKDDLFVTIFHLTCILQGSYVKRTNMQCCHFFVVVGFLSFFKAVKSEAWLGG